VPVPAHEATTRHLGAIYPFQFEPGLGAPGVLVGRDLLGGAFVFDPFALYRSGALTNPNMVVVGQIGRGKSALMKTYLWRQTVFGRRAWVIDPKGEYGALARAWGVVPLALRPGGALRLNPLDAALQTDPTNAAADDELRRRAELLGSLASASLERPLLPTERGALDLAVTAASGTAATDAAALSPLATASTRAHAAGPTLPMVVEALLHPSPVAARSVGTDVAGLAADGRNLALELRRLVAGDLRGMFDGPTTPGVRLDASFVVLDLSAVYHSAALGVLMTCAAAWLHAGLARAGNDGVIVVVDEAWAILANLGVARWLQSSWKLSRAWGVSNVALLHRLSDLDTPGTEGSEQVGLARGLLTDSETRVVYAQPAGELPRATALLGLSDTEAQLLPHLRRGVALWKVGNRSFLVEHRLSPSESDLVDTDARMEGRA
jgi:type IV secretory pathway VirB4 component